MPYPVYRQKRAALVANKEPVVAQGFQQFVLVNPAISLVGGHRVYAPDQVFPCPPDNAGGKLHPVQVGMSHRAAHERGVAHRRQFDVGHIAAVAPQQSGILAAQGSHRANSTAQ